MKSQQGLSAFGLLFLLIIGGFIALCGLKIAPLYYDNYKMDQIFVRVGTEGSPIQNLTVLEIRSRLSRQFGVDGVRDVSPNEIDITRRDGTVTLSLERERRVALFGNLDVVVSFENYYSTANDD